MHESPYFLREIVARLLQTGDWSDSAAETGPFHLWLGIDGIPPGLKVSYVFVLDGRGQAGGVWAPGRSPAAFYWACRGRVYKGSLRETPLQRTPSPAPLVWRRRREMLVFYRVFIVNSRSRDPPPFLWALIR